MNTHDKFPKVVWLLSVLLCSFVSVYAGDNDWKPIDPSDVALKAPKVEKDADAEAIFWEVRVDDSSNTDLALKHYIRIKIFTERGREKYSKIDLPFPKGMKVKDVAVRVVKPDGSIVELKKEDIFEKTIAKADGIKIKAKSFALPGLEPGVILEYRYKEVFQDASASNMPLMLQQDIPVQQISYYVKPHPSLGMKSMPFNVAEPKFNKDKDGFYRLTATNVPAFHEEGNMPPEEQVKSWVLIYYDSSNSMVANDYWARYGGQRVEAYKELTKPNGDVKKLATEITAGVSTPEEKIAKIFDYVRSQIKNIDYDYSLTDEQREKIKDNNNPGDTFKRKTGNSADVDLLFASLAKAAGFEVRIAFTGNRNELFFTPRNAHGRFIERSAIAIKVGDKYRFFDPCRLYLPAGMLPWYAEDQHAMLMGDKDFFWTITPISGQEKSVEKRKGKFKLLEDGTLEGEVRIEYTGHLGYGRKSANDEISQTQREDNLKEEVKKRISTAELSDIKIENITELGDKPFVYTYKVRVPGYASKVGKRLFLQPGFFEYGRNTVFNTTTRIHPIYFHYAWSEQDEIEIDLPKGFSLDNADSPGVTGDSQRISLQEINIAFNSGTNTLVYKRKFYFGNGGNYLFPAETYPAIKNIFDGFHKANTHQVTLKQN